MSSAGAITVASLLVAGVLGAAGCGDGGGGDSTTRAEARQPAPKQPISAEIGPFNRAIARQSCRDFQPLVFSIIRPRPPGSGVGPKECRGRNAALAKLRGGRFTRTRRYGTVALMEGPGATGDTEYAVWALDGDGRFRFTSVAGGPAQIGTPFTRGRQAAEITTAFIRSVAQGDCKAIAALLSPAGRLVFGQPSRSAACRTLLAGRFFAPAVRGTRNLRAEFMGGTQNLAFSGVATRRTYFTLLLSDVRVGHLRVLDVLPSTPVRISGA